MSITALVSGKLLSDPERRTAANGKSFTTARLSEPVSGAWRAMLAHLGGPPLPPLPDIEPRVVHLALVDPPQFDEVNDDD